ncbi:2,4-dienoyl-CoA reductase (NADPH2) [Rhizobium sp. BK275]|uniref:NADH:flavin oxidoreductase n=1 Tax=unclassified Rhizobium TaxID=2613769 RepID=UPI001613D4AC|nr:MULTISPECIES: NADH:flavin oxidoreductase [unclassified Rhizobium]MBB3388127.1 2,4-dienoyl-CoA reductase (NADPH2) [Rhizobium sp. BK275]MBB3407479.1 2,4-dienoyl-CoA reductase (NADPH2) [Rhizobium sp. BK316]
MHPDSQYTHADNAAVIFNELTFRSLRVKNRLFRSNISGQFDDYNGHGGHARLNWEEKFARGGIGCIISSFTPVSVRGRILVRYAMIDNDDKIPFWREVGNRVHAYDCRFIMQLSHSGRQQDMGGVENLFNKGLSSTNKSDYFHGLLAQAMTKPEIAEVVEQFAQGARRARQAGLDGVELHGANGYLLTQFLSSGINDRTDEYGGGWEGRARFVLEIVRAIRREVGQDFHLQMKINGVDHNDWLYPWIGKGNTLDETVKICTMLLDGGKGVDSFHISSGSTFPHPRNPAGDLPLNDLRRWYDGMLSQGTRAPMNYAIFSNPILGRAFQALWRWRRGKVIEGINLDYARAVSEEIVKIDPDIRVLCTGGFQHADRIADAIRSKACDGVTMARPLVANNDLPDILTRQNGPEKECTYCNKCLLNDLENPLGCYDFSRFDGDSFEERYDRMIKQVMSVYEPPTFQ